MNLKRISPIIVCVLFALVCQNSYGQSSAKLKTQLKIAEQQYKRLHFLSAIQHLKPILEADSTLVNAQEMMANSYRNLRNYDESLYWFAKLVEQPNMKFEWALYYAEALASKEKYEESEKWYRKYLSLVPKDKRASSFIKAGAASFQGNSDWVVYQTNLNTAASEYSPAWYKKGLLFVSNRRSGEIVKNVFGWDNTPYSNLYVFNDLTKIEKVKIDSTSSSIGYLSAYKSNDDDTDPTSNDSRVLGLYDPRIYNASQRLTSANAYPVKGKINTRFHEGPCVVSPDGTLFFTRNNYTHVKPGTSSDGTVKLKLFTASGANWDNLEELPFNSDEYSVGHPAISSDGNILIFVSDMPGGFGGKDLYYSVRVAGGKQWTRPVNMGKRINTEGNEMFPFWGKDGALFFSSTGYAGLGGLDVFEVVLKDLRPMGIPHNLGAPINSSADDFGLIRSEDGKNGYFSSNRSGNDDIYAYTRQSYSIRLAGQILDKQTKIAWPGSQIYLRTSDGIDTLKVNRSGEFTTELDKETDYEIIGYNPDYVTQRQFFSTTGMRTDTTIVVNFSLNKAEVSQRWVTKNCDSLKRVLNISNIYYDLDKAHVREQSKPVLDKIVQLMKQHPEISIITASHCDSRASAGYNKALSLRRGEATKSYLVSRGVRPGRVKIEYYGKSRLVNRCFDGVNCSEEDQQLNRRTEFDVVINGVNLSQMDCVN
ncbi:OmpA family protein [Paradesertivirga mongoliensis]|uniref:OmpA family protein n=1 Tax=Paradesertivirga mongoliensis TaxID=2100740 RepID=A0ABW4ZLI5_9SPHI|nr:OmpA family protein [Pedobacter mongoliensis]